MKKFLSVCLVLGLLVFCALGLDFKKIRQGACPFCSEGVVQRQLVMEGEGVVALLTHKPAAPGHLLIIPKRHVERFEQLSPEEMEEIRQMVKRIDERARRAFGHSDYLLLQKNGKGAGQSVPHLHFHYLPAVRFLALRFFISPWLKPIDREEISRLKGLLSEET